MTFNVRIQAYKGVVTAPLNQVRQQSSDSVLLLSQPYLSAQKLPSNGAVPVAAAASPKGTKLLRVEVDDGDTIRYELEPNGNGNQAGTNSPSLSGINIIDCGEGWVFNFVDAAAV